MPNEIVKRNYTFTHRAETDKGDGYIRGVGAVFGQPTDIGGMFKEIIHKDAFKDVDLSQVKGFFNHDLNSKALTSNLIPLEKLGGMEITITDDEVIIDQHLNLKRTDANDLYLGIEDGVFNGMSFMFGVAEEKWEGLDTDYPTRTIMKIDPVIEFSVVNYPAYKQTSIGLRSVESAESDSIVLEKARTDYLNKRNAENNATSELELEKLKAKFLYKI